MYSNIPKFVITGGPCGGKSSAMALLVERLSALGYTPFVVPEAATILKNRGLSPRGGEAALRIFQESVFDLIVALEDEAAHSAINGVHPKPVILCDRGLLDARAYTPREMFREITVARGHDMMHLRDMRYHAVFHLRTAALGAEEFYTTENNVVRDENPDEARAIDELTLNAWVGHPSVAVIGNDVVDFDAKLELLWRHVLRALGEHEIERRFLVAPVDLSTLPVPQERIPIEQLFVTPETPETIRRIRKRSVGSGATYHETVKGFIRPGVAHEQEWSIESHEYDQLKTLRVQDAEVIHKYRHCFVYKDQYFELDEFAGPLAGLFILEIELLHENDPVELPPFLSVIKEVTGDGSYSNYALATLGLPR